jgi:hypothetical protein
LKRLVDLGELVIVVDDGGFSGESVWYVCESVVAAIDVSDIGWDCSNVCDLVGDATDPFNVVG